MSETVTRVRLTDSGEKDRYDKPILTPVEETFTARGFAPVVTDDVKGVDAIVSSDGGTLYFRAPNMVDSLPGDRWIVRGVEYASEGREAAWKNLRGHDVGTVVVLKRTEFTDG